MRAGTIFWWGIGALMGSGILYAYEQAKADEIAAAQVIQEEADKYCAKMKDGVMVVMFRGKAITGDVFLKDGSTVKADGTVISKGGQRSMLKEGQCIDAYGKINPETIKEPYQKEE